MHERCEVCGWVEGTPVGPDPICWEHPVHSLRAPLTLPPFLADPPVASTRRLPKKRTSG